MTDTPATDGSPGEGSEDRSQERRPRDETRGGVVAPWDARALSDKIWPQLHDPWWNRNFGEDRPKRFDETLASVRAPDLATAKLTLSHIEEIADSALERTASAERRATTIASAVAVAASFTLTGAGVLVDAQKWSSQAVRVLFAVALFITAGLFVLAAVYALQALVAKRNWHWTDPHQLDENRKRIVASKDAPGSSWRSAEHDLLEMRAAQTLEHFALNWEISDLKNRNVDNALRCLVSALIGITILAGLILAEVI